MNNPCWIVKAVQPLPDYRLLIPFEKGEKRVFDFKPYLKYKINEPLKHVVSFKKNNTDKKHTYGKTSYAVKDFYSI